MLAFECADAECPSQQFFSADAECPSQQFFSHVGTEPPLPGSYQYFRGVKCHAQGHNTAEVSFKPPTSRSGV